VHFRKKEKRKEPANVTGSVATCRVQYADGPVPKHITIFSPLC
jgi:hypothetical protein